uniref:Tyrosine-protein kinase n=1 Tax=Panagrolaimus sp. JU765 TaxID=591449 RepID=A0AC34QIY3_9BILA
MSILVTLPYFHGLLPREEIGELLVKTGDFILRFTEPSSDGVKLPVLSIRTDHGLHHVMFVKSKDYPGKYELGTMIDTVPNIIEFYLEKGCKMFNRDVSIKRAIGRQSWEFMMEDVEILKPLGQGAFGEVRLGKLRLPDGKKIDVAVKLAMSQTLNKDQIREYMNEARIMRRLNHPHVVRYHGVCVLKEPLMIIMELAEDGALENLIKKANGSISIEKKMEMCLQAAWGLEYLHDYSIIHRDIAARNCLYGDGKVKLSDFGLARYGTYYKLTNKKKQPIRWLAPEAFSGHFYTKSDVYSFGVLCWEIFTDCAVEPYRGLTVVEIIKLVKSGERLELPSTVPSSYAEVIKNHCWTHDVHERWTISEVVSHWYPILYPEEAKIKKPMKGKPSKPQKISPSPSNVEGSQPSSDLPSEKRKKKHKRPNMSQQSDSDDFKKQGEANNPQKEMLRNFARNRARCLRKSRKSEKDK